MRWLGRNTSGLGSSAARALREGRGWDARAVGSCYLGAETEEGHWDLRHPGKGVGSAALRVLGCGCLITTLKMPGGS